LCESVKKSVIKAHDEILEYLAASLTSAMTAKAPTPAQPQEALKCKFCGDMGRELDEYGYCTLCVEGMRRTNGD